MIRKDFPIVHFYNQDFVNLYEESWIWIDEYIKKGTKKSGFASTFFNHKGSKEINQVEACFSTFFLVYSNSIYNSGAVLDNFYSKQEKNGAIRGVYSLSDGKPVVDPKNQEGLQPPLFAWAEYNLFHKTGNKKRLKEVIVPLQKYYDWIESKYKKSDGLYSVPMSATQTNYKQRKKIYHQIDFNAQQALNALYIAAIGDILNDRDISFKYKRAYFSLKTRINEKMWDKETNFYYDMDKEGNFIKVKTLISYWVLLAELPNQDNANKMIDKLKNEKEFGTDHPFPTLSVDEEDFNEDGGTFEGAVYPHLNFMVIKGLEKYRENEFARECSIRHLFFILDQAIESEDSDEPELDLIYEAYKPTDIGPATFKPKTEPRNKFITYACLTTITLMIENLLGFYISLPKKTVNWIVPILDQMGIENLSLKRNKIKIKSQKSSKNGMWEIRLESDKLYYFTINIMDKGKKTTLPIPSGKCSILIDKL